VTTPIQAKFQALSILATIISFKSFPLSNVATKNRDISSITVEI